MGPLLIHKRYEDDNTALHIAASFETQFDIIKDLIVSGANVHADNCNKETPLFVAAELENYNNASRLVIYGARVNEIEKKRGQTPMHIAAYNDDVNMLKLLTRRNSIDVNVADKAGKTPLSYAVIRNSRSAVRHLLERGADTSIKDSNGLNSLHLSVLTRNTEITEDILSVSNQSLVNEKNIDGKSPLILAVDRNSQTFDTNTMKMIDILLEKGANPHQKDNVGETAQSMACTKGLDLDSRTS